MRIKVHTDQLLIKDPLKHIRSKTLVVVHKPSETTIKGLLGLIYLDLHLCFKTHQIDTFYLTTDDDYFLPQLEMVNDCLKDNDIVKFK